MVDNNENKETSLDSSLLAEGETPLDTGRLSEAVIQLNIARRNVGMYPPGHAQVEQSIGSAHAILREILAIWPQILLGVAKDTLLVGEEYLDSKNPVYRDFAMSLNDRGIAAVTFDRGLAQEEVAKFAQILNTAPEEITANGGIKKAVSEASISNIIIQELDYSGFHLTEEDEIVLPEGKEESSDTGVWQGFVSQLVSGALDSSDSGVLLEDSIQIDPALLAKLLNESKLETNTALESYEHAVAQHVRRVIERDQLTEEQSSTFANLMNLVQNLEPDLRKQFLSVASKHFTTETLSAGADRLLDGFTDNMIIDMMRQVSEEGREIPHRLMEIVQRLSSALDEDPSQSIGEDIDPAIGVPMPGISQDDMQALFKEEAGVGGGDSDHDATLQVLAGGAGLEEMSAAPAFPLDEYLETLEDNHLDLQIGLGLLAFMERDVDHEDYEALIDKLLTLLPNLVENGQFSFSLDVLEALRTHSGERPHADLSSLSEGATRLEPAEATKKKSERIRETASNALKMLREPDFVSRAVSEFDNWADTRGREASNFLLALGPSSIPELIDLYADSESPSESGVLFKLLLDFGHPATSEAQARLDDTRSHYVRNLLVFLQQAGSSAALPYVTPLVQHHDREVRMEALSILLKFKDPSGTTMLRNALLSRDKYISSQAVFLAGRYRHVDVVRDLISMLKKRPLLKSGYAANEKIIGALGEIGDAQAVPILENLIRSRWMLYPDTLSRMKVVLFESLESYPLESLEGLLNIGKRSDNARIRKACRQIIEKG